MILRLCLVACVLMACRGYAADREAVISLTPTAEIETARIAVRMPASSQPTAVLVLCPGQNGDGGQMIRDSAWADFADRHHFALAGLYFQSPDELLRNHRGYFEADRGSGRLLLEGLEKLGLDGLPVYLYGFSGGAHFARNFASFAPDRVQGFVSYSFGWSRPPAKELACPAVIACRDRDGIRLASTLEYFQAGRRVDLPWIWVTLGDTGHHSAPRLEEFEREFFAVLLRLNCHTVAVDDTTKEVVPSGACNRITVSVVPESLLPSWRSLHRP